MARKGVIPSERSESRDLHLQSFATYSSGMVHVLSGMTSRCSMSHYFVYILANRSRGLYIGVTNDLSRRVAQHRVATEGFSARYRCARLVLVETTPDVRSAIAREKQLKNWRREKKIALIQARNPAWDNPTSPCLGSAISLRCKEIDSEHCRRQARLQETGA